MRESKESIQSWVSSGSMSGSWVGSPSWMTVGMAPLRWFSVLDVGVSSTVTRSSLHAPEGQKIYPSVSGAQRTRTSSLVDTGCALGGTPVDYSPLRTTDLEART